MTRSLGAASSKDWKRFAAKYEEDANGCWVWIGSRLPKGYGLFWMNHAGSHPGLAHRTVFEWFKGPIPDGLHVDHLCSNPSCVNPEHLEAVSVSENNRRSRARSLGSTSSIPRHPDEAALDPQPRGGEVEPSDWRYWFARAYIAWAKRLEADE